jgi:hypothetical protein
VFKVNGVWTDARRKHSCTWSPGRAARSPSLSRNGPELLLDQHESPAEVIVDVPWEVSLSLHPADNDPGWDAKPLREVDDVTPVLKAAEGRSLRWRDQDVLGKPVGLRSVFAVRDGSLVRARRQIDKGAAFAVQVDVTSLVKEREPEVVLPPIPHG